MKFDSTPNALLDAVTADGSGSVMTLNGKGAVKIFIKSASVTTGANVVIYEQSPEGDWHAIHTEAVSTDGNQDVIYLPGPFLAIRPDIESRTDGTYTVSAIAG